jgi:hypothetical protein
MAAPRTVLFGHSAYYIEDGKCTIPDGTTFTLYTPPGALLDQVIATALANGEVIRSSDLSFSTADWYFMTHELPMPVLADKSMLSGYPRTFKAGEIVPNLYLNPAELTAPPAFAPVPTQVIRTQTTTFLSELLAQFAGHDIHWAGCTFAKQPDASAIGYGYSYTFSYTSPLKAVYQPELTEEQKKENRKKKFGECKPYSDTQERAARNHARIFSQPNRANHERDNASALSQHRQRTSPY